MANNYWKPLLSATLPLDYDLEKLTYPLFASPKIDGFRMTVQGGLPLTRKGLTYRNAVVRELYGADCYEGLDGELCVGPPWATDVFNRTQNCVNSGGEEAAATFRKHGCFWVIDYHEVGGYDSFKKRYEWLIGSYGDDFVKIINQTLVKNAAQLRAYYDKTTAKGYEGVMLRRGDSGPYPQKPGKENRSTLKEVHLVKWKPFEYSFARITACFPLEPNVNEEKTAAGKRSTKKAGIVVDHSRVGSVTLRDVDTGVEFDMTVQTTKLQEWVGWRQEKNWKGKVVRYKHQACGAKEKPRVASCPFAELGVGK